MKSDLTNKHNMAIPESNDMLSLLQQYKTSEKDQENDKVLQPPEGLVQLSENCPWFDKTIAVCK